MRIAELGPDNYVDLVSVLAGKLHQICAPFGVVKRVSGIVSHPRNVISSKQGCWRVGSFLKSFIIMCGSSSGTLQVYYYDRFGDSAEEGKCGKTETRFLARWDRLLRETLALETQIR